GSDSDTAPATGNGAIQSSAQRPRVQSAPAGQDSGDFREQISGNSQCFILLPVKNETSALTPVLRKKKGDSAPFDH
ncbi:hypothetical protein ACTM6F_19290, partial [Citrobacter freundii]